MKEIVDRQKELREQREFYDNLLRSTSYKIKLLEEQLKELSTYFTYFWKLKDGVERALIKVEKVPVKRPRRKVEATPITGPVTLEAALEALSDDELEELMEKLEARREGMFIRG